MFSLHLEKSDNNSYLEEKGKDRKEESYFYMLSIFFNVWLTIIVETSPSLEHFFHSPMLKCLNRFTFGCCQTKRWKMSRQIFLIT